MKKFIFLFAFILPLMSTGQHTPQKRSLTKEQRIQLQTKKLHLLLDLSEKQIGEIQSILEQHMKTASKKQKALSDEQRYEMKVKWLDRQIALQNEYKSVLTPEQFELWRKLKSKEKFNRRYAHHGSRHAAFKENRRKYSKNY